MEPVYNFILFTYLSNLLVIVVISFIGMMVLSLIEREKKIFLALLEINMTGWLEILIIVGTKKIIPLMLIHLIGKYRKKIKKKIKEIGEKRRKNIKLEEWVIRR